MKRTYAPSTVIAVRYHKEELKDLDKARKKKARSVYIREKSLNLTS